MKRIQCELCGSNEIVKENDFFVCKHCGTKYSLEEAQKLLVKVEIDKSKETENWLILARRARSDENKENASKYYGLVLEQDPNNWEAAFFHNYCKASDCNLREISSAVNTISNSLLSTIPLIEKYEKYDTDKLDAFKEIANSSMRFAESIGTAAVSFKQNHRDNPSAHKSANGWISDGYRLFITLTVFDDGHYPWLSNSDGKHFFVEIWKRHNNYLAKYGDAYNAAFRTQKMNEGTAYITSVDKSYIEPTKSSTQPKGCYIATCVYGSYDCPQVWTLRRYRDNKLSQTARGRLFIKVYYGISPKIVRLFGKMQLFKRFIRKQLDIFVENLNQKGFEDTPYLD